MARSARPVQVHPIALRHLDVLRVQDVTPGMRRVTLGGDQLQPFVSENGFSVAAFRSDGFDDDVRVILKHPDATTPSLPTQAEGNLYWARDPHQLLRTYTVRRWDSATGELDLDFVKHGSGPATSWAYRAQVGDRIHIAGPKLSTGEPAGADWILIAGDETALPAIGRWIDEFSTGVRAKVFIEVADETHRQNFAVPPGVEVMWLDRAGAPAGTTTLLYDAITGTDWWEGSVFAWVAGEAVSIAPIRRWLRTQKELAKEFVDVTGYWRRSESGTATPAADIPDTGEVEVFEDNEIDDLLDVVAGVALRVGITVGLFEALAHNASTVEELVSATGTHTTGTTKLLRYLTQVGVVEVVGDRYQLTDKAKDLGDEYYAEEMSLDGSHARWELGVLALLSAVRVGSGDYARWFGAEYRDLRLADAAGLVHEEEDSDYVALTLAKSEQFDGIETLVVTGPRAGAFAGAFADAHPALRVTIAGHPSELTAVRSVYGERKRITMEASSLLEARQDSPSAILFVGAFDVMPDEDAVHVLRQAGRSVDESGAVYVFGEPIDHTVANRWEYQDDLLSFAVTGGGKRQLSEYEALAGSAGLTLTSTTSIGWGEVLLRLVPTE
ncbi:hypothetical protein CH300_03635 [Rhodococcus sp. 15-1154-1]|nr:siderophore-interacting protein [Rhodococcus sp. 15-1154-1]OZF08449.1 hypothetical protein CH300_03635 [Rhodococcus sp. 15-1154-1]